MTVFVEWVIGHDAITELREGAGPTTAHLSTAWLSAVGIVLPLFLTFTLLSTATSTLSLDVSTPATLALAIAVVAAVALALRRPISVL